MNKNRVTSTPHFRGENAIAVASVLLALVVDEMVCDKDAGSYLERLRVVQFQLEQGILDLSYDWSELSTAITDTSMMETIGYEQD